ncbi:hypothetical protein AAW05_25825, partial [Escherichia coli]
SLHPGVFCRDAGSAGHGATRVARPFRSLQTRVFASGMEARQGDARKRHKQENNKTDSNQSSRKKKNSSSSSSSSRNNNIISNRQMTGLKRQKPTAERPRNERGGA